MSTWGDREPRASIGTAFLEFASFFRMYAVLMNRHAATAALLANLSEGRPAFAAFLAAAQAAPRSNNQTLESLLIMPVQRLPRYQLLLAELIKLVRRTRTGGMGGATAS